MKLFLTYVVACLIPILLTSIYLTTNLANFTKENTRLLSVSSDELLKKNILNVTENIENILNTIISENDLTNYLTTQQTSDYDALMSYIKSIDKRINSLISGKYKILIYSDNSTIGISRMTNNTIADFYGLFSGKVNTISDTPIHTGIINRNLRSELTLCFYKFLTLSNDKTIIYTVEIPVSILVPYSESPAANTAAIYLFDEQELVLASSRKEDVFSSFSTLKFDDMTSIEKLSKSEIVKLDGVKYGVFFGNISNNTISSRSFKPSWNLLYLVPYSNLQANLNMMLANSLLIIIICVLLSLIMASLMAKDITRRIIMLSGKTKDVLNGDFEIMSPVESKDELGSLEADIYEMVIYLKNMLTGITAANQSLMEEKLITQRLQQEKITAELLALRSQINPHFLFNTLETIRMNLVLKDDMDTANIIWMFSQSYRTMFKTEQDNYTLNDELKLVYNYVQVQNYRLDDKLTYHIFMDPALGDLIVPKLLLQPLVENSIYHGVEELCRRSDVTVTITASEDELTIVVTDNGAGIEETRLADIRRALSDKSYLPKEFLALRNIQTRIQLISRWNCSMSIESEYGIGTTVHLTLPLIWKNDSNSE